MESHFAECRDEAAQLAEMMTRARAAQKQIEHYTQEQVDALITAMVWAVVKPDVAEEIARFAVEETQLGNYEGKYLKIFRKTRATLYDIIHEKSVGVIEEDKERNIVKIAKPIGVIGALAPCTNPEATPVIKAMFAIKGRNAIIIAPHPRSKLTNKLICDRMRAALREFGAPEDLVIAIEHPSLELTGELMKQCDRILATGGAAMVKSAYASGTPALGVGAGNAVIVVDDTADLDEAAEKIRISKTLDLAASCSSDNAVVALEPVADALLDKLQAEGGYLCSNEEKRRLQNIIWEDGHLSTRIVAQPADVLAAMAGIDLPEGKRFFIVPEQGAGAEYPFSGEKMSVVMAFYREPDLDAAIEKTNAIQAYQGQGHSCGIYSYNDDNILRFAGQTYTSRVMVNQPQAPSNSGNVWNGMRQTFSLGCGSWGGNATNNNISWQDLVNVTWVSKPLAEPKQVPADELLFASAIAAEECRGTSSATQ